MSSTSNHLKTSFIIFFIFNLINTSKSNITTGYQITLAVPTEYIQDFTGKAFLMETNGTKLKFQTALSVNSNTDGKYSCSLQIFLGSTVKVWDSGHRSKFYTTEMCVLELTKHGDLRLLGPNQRVGWRTGTTEQGVQGLQLLKTGNLVLVDSLGQIKWQTFNFPTDVLLQGQRLSVSTRLTSYPTYSNSTTTTASAQYYYSLEIQHDKLALCLNSPPLDQYSYWEFQPTKGKNITYVELTSQGLELFDDQYQRFSQIISPRSAKFLAVKFLALENDTGNLGMYYYSPNYKTKFQPSFEVINSTCDLPLTCTPYGICSSPGDTCSCISLSSSTATTTTTTSDCSSVIGGGTGYCGKPEPQMVELEGATTILKTTNSSFMFHNVTKKGCRERCLNDCQCSAALYRSDHRDGTVQESCMLYDVVRGVRTTTAGANDVQWANSYYMIKVPKSEGRKWGGLRKWVLVLIVVADVLILFLVFGSIGYFIVWKRRKRFSAGE